MDTSSDTPGLPRGTLYAMALAAGLAVANIYYNQPMLGVMTRDLHSAAVEKWVPGLTQLGYAAGLLFLLPLGDTMERRGLIVWQFVALALALVLAALAPGLATLAAASVAVGATSTVAQQIVPFATVLSAPARRGAAVGTVMSGLLSGILLSRTVAGFVSTLAGWRAMFWLAVPLALAGAWLMRRRLPRHLPERRIAYRALLASLGGLWKAEPLLRRAALTQAVIFASFSVFWTVLSLRLEQPPLRLGAASAGLFGVVGAVGVAMAPVAGRMADRRGPWRVIAIGAAATVVSWIVFALWPSLSGLVAGVILLDFGAQIALVSHQQVIYGLHPEFKSRLNTVFMTTMFLGGAFGSFAAASAWRLAGWTGVCAVGGGLALVALASRLFAIRERKPHAGVTPPPLRSKTGHASEETNDETGGQEDSGHRRG